MLSDRTLFRAALLGSAFALTAFIPAGAQAQTYKILHSFAGAPGDGSTPYADLQLDSAGNLYGTAGGGGAHNAGVIFKLAPDGTETVLYSFTGGADGSNPNTGVTLDEATGDLYGTTTYGGSSGCGGSGCGVIWKLAAKGTYTVLHALDGGADGAGPAGRLIRDALGNFYGVASGGGASADGTVFELTAKGRFKALHAFSGTPGDGANPGSRLETDKAGNLYGVTGAGGAGNYGTVFKVAPDGTETVLYNFTGQSDGGLPAGGLARDKQGNLYGTTIFGGSGDNGVVLKLAQDGSLSVLHTFAGGADGANPQGDLLRTKAGKLYGATNVGGAHNDGTVFELDPDGTETVLHSFAGADGAIPVAGLARSHGVLYGTTAFGGVHGDGVVFRVKEK
jgi:uncharacterized repeat protein (TIGR03803 family)